MNRAGADDDKDAVIFTVKNIANDFAAVGDSGTGLVGQWQLGFQLTRGDERGLRSNIEIIYLCLGHVWSSIVRRERGLSLAESTDCRNTATCMALIGKRYLANRLDYRAKAQPSLRSSEVTAALSHSPDIVMFVPHHRTTAPPVTYFCSSSSTNFGTSTVAGPWRCW